MKLIISLIVIANIFLKCEGKIYTKCEFVSELRSYGITETSELEYWVTVAAPSNFDTRESLFNAYGIFGINPQEWCDYKKPGGLCNIQCYKLLDDDIGDDLKCALHIKEHHHNPWSDRFIYQRLYNVNIDMC